MLAIDLGRSNKRTKKLLKRSASARKIQEAFKEYKRSASARKIQDAFKKYKRRSQRTKTKRRKSHLSKVAM